MRDRAPLRTLAASLLIAGCALGALSSQALAAASVASTPPQLLLAGIGSSQVDPALYLTSEKYDGVRAYWDGHTLRFRSGRPIAAPQWFVRRLPAQSLDGELWIARRRFDALSAIVRSEKPVDADWRLVRYMVFELPGAPGDFAQRTEQLGRIVRAAGWAQLQAVSQYRLADHAALKTLFEQTVAAGGEGLMLHLAAAPYTTGRGEALLKLKPQLDSEAVVIGQRPGRGKYAGMLGALQVRAADGRIFWIGSGFSDAQRRQPPPIGSTVTYRYRDLTARGLPRFASFLRLHDGL